jgi:hypothetical protein
MMKAVLTETIFYTFNFEEAEKVKKFKEGHLSNGFELLSEYIPTTKENGQGYIELRKKTEFKN